jgi:hypothetical protein
VFSHLNIDSRCVDVIIVLQRQTDRFVQAERQGVAVVYSNSFE